MEGAFFTNTMPVDEDERIGGAVFCTCGCHSQLAVTHEGYIELGNEESGYHGIWLSSESASELVRKLQTYVVDVEP